MAATTDVLQKILDERARQDRQWGGPEHDDKHTPEQWLEIVANQEWNAEVSQEDPETFRECLVKIAAVAVAAVEAMERKEHNN